MWSQVLLPLITIGHFSLHPMPKKPAAHGCVQSTPVQPVLDKRQNGFHIISLFYGFNCDFFYLYYKCIRLFECHRTNHDSTCILIGNHRRKIPANILFRNSHLKMSRKKLVNLIRMHSKICEILRKIILNVRRVVHSTDCNKKTLFTNELYISWGLSNHDQSQAKVI